MDTYPEKGPQQTTELIVNGSVPHPKEGAQQVTIAPIPQPAWSREQVELIRNTVAKGTTDDELALFLYVCKRTGLDPLTRQIHAIKRWNRDDNRESMAIQTGIGGYRLTAARTGEHAGTDDATYDDESGAHPTKATVTVYRFEHGRRCPFTASARWEEYVQTKRGGEITAMWRKMPYVMLGKCAEALALRKAFPAELSGLYTHEEMMQADTPADTPREGVSGTSSDPVQARLTPVVKPEVTAGPKVITEGQLRMLHNACEAFNVETDRLEQYLTETYQIEALTLIPVGKFGDVLHWIKLQKATDLRPSRW